MEKNEVVKKYELAIIIDAVLSDSEKEAVCKEAAEIVNKAGAKVINSEVWIEKHNLIFEIQKCKEGSFYLVNFEGNGPSINKMRSGLKLNERILRSIITKV
jgi:small subunit ribosomal protein S6